MADLGVLAAIEQLKRGDSGKDPAEMDADDIKELLGAAGGNAGGNGGFDNLFGTPFDGKDFDEAAAKDQISKANGRELDEKTYYGRSDTDVKGGDGRWKWEQNGEEVQVRFHPETPLTKKDVEVKIKTNSLLVKIRGEIEVESPLFGPVIVDECTWCIVGGELQIMVTKQRDDQVWTDFLDRSS
mmetsp:Transcript_54572/g.122781  ORF Transcript_54572/g.122781 Transcript_54572/m.122781 type:complete len:184 (+) Transcript_54572:72-623(+)